MSTIQLQQWRWLAARPPVPVLGEFSKAVPGAVSINFARSAGPNCDLSCAMYNHGCYSETLEGSGRRPGLVAKLARHEATRADHLLDRAVKEMRAQKAPPWVRISTAGSLPPDPGPGMAKAWKRFADYLIENGLRRRHHIPVETAKKAAQYRRLDRRLTVRESTQTLARWLSARGPVSCVAGKMGTSFEARIAAAQYAAQTRRELTGRPVCVCPAVVQGWRRRAWTSRRAAAVRRGVEMTRPEPAAVKCGECCACSLPTHDIVFPIHH
jgi:hypothetical protein